jgi:hypothetical protein
MNNRHYYSVAAWIGVAWYFAMFWFENLLWTQPTHGSRVPETQIIWPMVLLFVIGSMTIALILKSLILSARRSVAIWQMFLCPWEGAFLMGLVSGGIMIYFTFLQVFRYYYIAMPVGILSVIALRKVSGLPAIPPPKRA